MGSLYHVLWAFSELEKEQSLDSHDAELNVSVGDVTLDNQEQLPLVQGTFKVPRQTPLGKEWQFSHVLRTDGVPVAALSAYLAVLLIRDFLHFQPWHPVIKGVVCGKVLSVLAMAGV